MCGERRLARSWICFSALLSWVEAPCLAGILGSKASHHQSVIQTLLSASSPPSLAAVLEPLLAEVRACLHTDTPRPRPNNKTDPAAMVRRRGTRLEGRRLLLAGLIVLQVSREGWKASLASGLDQLLLTGVGGGGSDRLINRFNQSKQALATTSAFLVRPPASTCNAAASAAAASAAAKQRRQPLAAAGAARRRYAYVIIVPAPSIHQCYIHSFNQPTGSIDI